MSCKSTNVVVKNSKSILLNQLFGIRSEIKKMLIHGHLFENFYHLMSEGSSLLNKPSLLRFGAIRFNSIVISFSNAITIYYLKNI